MASGANVLILDEPTNHLDIDAREALEDALSAFDGTVLLVSHDRALLDAVGTRTIALEDGRLHSYQGGWAEYSRVREERRQAERARPGRESGPTAKAKAAAKPRATAGEAAGPSKNALGARPSWSARSRGRGGAARDRRRAGRSLAVGSPTSSERETKRHAAAKKRRRGGVRALGAVLGRAPQ